MPPVAELPAHSGTPFDEPPATNPSFDLDLDFGDSSVGDRATLGLAPVGDFQSQPTWFVHLPDPHRSVRGLDGFMKQRADL